MANQEWFSRASLVSIGGSSMAVTVTVNTIRSLVSKKWNIRTTQRFVFMICLLIAGVSNGLQSPYDLLSWFLMPLNACLLFCTALGMNKLGDKATLHKHGAMGEPRFFESWIE
jgi:hypothetical protein